MLEGVGKVIPEEGTQEELVDLWVELERNIRRRGVGKDLVTLRRMPPLIGYGWSFGLENGHRVNKKGLRERRCKDNDGGG